MRQELPSSLIIVALAVAWLVVLVPMVVRKRQAVARTTDTELAARVVRGGSEEFTESEEEDTEPEAPVDSPRAAPGRDAVAERRYRPGRGGFDPEAAEIAARARYAFRQRVVLTLLILAVGSAVGAGLLVTKLWWAHAGVDVALVGYLGYLRRQVRIETEIRQRRLARLNSARVRRPGPPRADAYADRERDEPRREPAGVERRPALATRIRGSAVVVDVDDEDPEFHELDDPGQLPFRRAVGE